MSRRYMALGMVGLFVMSLFSVIQIAADDAAGDGQYTPPYSILVASYEWHPVGDEGYCSGWVKEFFTDGSSKLILNEDVNGPTDAVRVAGGNTLVTVDYGLNQRVAELNMAGQTVWQYTTGINGPWHSTRLGNGNTLIADHWANRVIEVNAAGEIVWQIPAASGLLYYPLDADRLANGNTLIVDSYHNRVIEVDSNKNIIWNMPTANPYDAERSSTGNTMITSHYYGGVKEFNKDKELVWSWGTTTYPRSFDAEYLDNGNILVSAGTVVYEVNRNHEIVWQKNVGGTVFGVEAVNPPNNPPAADAGADQNGYLGTQFSFDGSESSDPDGTIVSYDWDFGDGTQHASGATPSHTYANHGQYTVTLKVTDDDGATGTDTLKVTVLNNPPSAAIAGGDRTLITNEEAEFDGSGSTDADGTISSFSWDWGDSSAAGSGSVADHKWSVAGEYTVTLTVTDDDGATGQVTAKVFVKEPAAAVDDTVDVVVGMALDSGVQTGLVAKLNEASDKLEQGQPTTAKNKLNAFINQVQAQKGKKISDAQADVLIGMAEWIIDNIP